MKKIQIENFENPTIGTIRGFIDEKGEPWFLAGQVCRCLGIKNSSDAISRIIEEHNRYQDHLKGVGISYPLLQTEGGKQKVCVISEPILYELIFKSEKEKAFRFRQWIFKEVLPSLRKHGEYRMQGKLIRRSLTDTIKDSGENERMHGHGYSNYSVMINKSLGLPNKVDRNGLEPKMLEKIAIRENLVQSMITEGKTYQEIKAVIETTFTTPDKQLTA